MGNTETVEALYKRHRRVKLVFNPAAGSAGKSPVQLMDIISRMQYSKLLPEVYMTGTDSDMQAMVNEAVDQGIRMFAVCGGDGTVSAVAKALVGIPSTLGIIPTGTQNNIAFSLGIPMNIPKAIDILRAGRRVKVDAAVVSCKEKSLPFLEICSMGLMSALYQSGDDIQHGDLSRIGDFLSAFASFPLSDIHLITDDGRDIKEKGHMALISNMPYVCRHYHVGPRASYKDGLLDVLLFSGLSKLELAGCFIRGLERNKDDARIRRFRASGLEIETNPAMPVMADGEMLGIGAARFKVIRHALSVMTGPAKREEGPGADGKDGK